MLQNVRYYEASFVRTAAASSKRRASCGLLLPNDRSRLLPSSHDRISLLSSYKHFFVSKSFTSIVLSWITETQKPFQQSSSKGSTAHPNRLHDWPVPSPSDACIEREARPIRTRPDAIRIYTVNRITFIWQPSAGWNNHHMDFCDFLWRGGEKRYNGNDIYRPWTNDASDHHTMFLYYVIVHNFDQ